MSYWGRRSGPSHGVSGSWPQPPQPPPQLPLGGLIETLIVDGLVDDAASHEKNAVISDAAAIASYSWLNEREPTILIPGKPPRWTPLKIPTRLAEDSGSYFRDKNAARFPKHPMEPAVLAALEAAPDLRHEFGVDIVACSSTLGNLLRFVRGKDKLFRMLVEVVDGTVFFIRRENSPRELIEGVRGFGHTFPEAYTSWDADVRGSDCHERLLRYSFGGLKCLVRFGTDGYIEEKKQQQQQHVASSNSGIGDAFTSTAGLADTLGGVSISTQHSHSPEKLHMKPGGILVDQDLVFDLKTRSVKKKGLDTLGEELPRFWVAQIPNFIIAYHERGLFKDINVRDVRDEVKKWEKTNNETLSKLSALIHRIVNIVRDSTSGKLEICHTRAGSLHIREQASGCDGALSPAVQAMWKASGESSKEPSPQEEDTVAWDDGKSEDFTACSASCGYCGRCA